MNSSKASPKVAAPHPKEAAARFISICSDLCINATETATVKSITRKTLPPDNIAVLTEAVTILAAIGIVAECEAQTYYEFAKRNTSTPNLNQRPQQKCYPVCFAIRRLYRYGNEYPQTRDESIRQLVSFAKRFPSREKFTGHMYYKHVIAWRDVFESYWEVVADAQHRGDHSRGDRQTDIVEFIEEQKISSLLTENTKLKFRIADALLGDRLVLGGAWPRQSVDRRRPRQIGSTVPVANTVLEEISGIAQMQSAIVEEPYMDDVGVSVAIQYPDGASTRDKQKVSRFATNIFARTNVRTLADMNTCSAVTYSDYLTYAAKMFPCAEYALFWLAAFPGIDVSRSIVLKASDEHIPDNDSILLDLSSKLLEYNILRRRRRSDNFTYETAGTMRLPIPEAVCAGLAQLIADNNQCDVIDSCGRLASAYSKTHSGLTPTLIRLRASSRIFVATRQFTELEFCAVSGRVVPALKGISAYYPKNVVNIVLKFSRAYESAAEDLGIVVPKLEGLPRLRSGSRNHLFCKPSPGIGAVQELMDAICRAYVENCVRLESLGCMVTPEDLVDALQLHETACYVLQQIALGIRPIGMVADYVAASSTMSAMAKDKGSRLFSERSYSPVSDRHAALLSCAQKNRLELQRALQFVGGALKFEEPNSSLACDFVPENGKNSFIAARLTNDYFRHRAPVASQIVDRNYASNWLRHVSTEYVSGLAPQWQLDELYSHRRIGREATSKWSTAGLSHFRELREGIDVLVAELVGDHLLAPVPSYSASPGIVSR